MTGILAVIRRSKLLVVAAAFVGLGAGLVLTVVHPTQYTSRALVVVVHAKSMKIQAIIAQSDLVLRGAQVSTHKRGNVHAQVVGNDIIAITVQEPGADLARSEAQQVAVSYIRLLHTPGSLPGRASAILLQHAQPAKAVRTIGTFALAGLLGLLAGLSATLGFLVPRRSRVTARPA
jgi:hypothetical protein